MLNANNNPNQVTVVMYHYVRNFALTPFPDIKGLLVSEFDYQINYFRKKYNFVTIEQCIAALKGECSLPRNSILLTFDDAFLDHYTNVFPILDKYNIQGSFFPPAKAVMGSCVLEVNKIQFILSKADNVDLIILDIFKMIDENRLEFSLESNKYYLHHYLKPRRFDNKNIGFVKNILQKGLPRKFNELLLDKLFHKYVTTDENALSHELYMTAEQLNCMVRNGMYVGSHCYDHVWLDSLNEQEQEYQIDLSLKFLNQIGAPIDNWVMCYPHGGYNLVTKNILERKGCALGLTVNNGAWLLDRHNKYEVPRFDTNDFPKKPS